MEAKYSVACRETNEQSDRYDDRWNKKEWDQPLWHGIQGYSHVVENIQTRGNSR
jgi:hypothetical protein